MKQSTLSVNTDNIFPIIKKFLYSDNEIFLRELISNSVDATTKLKKLTATGEFNQEIGEESITVTINKEDKTLTIKDRGLGMSEDEVERYINQIAFSSAEEFVQKFKEQGESANIIGHFGLGFYSSFMVASKVEFFSQSYRENEDSVHWQCDGSINYTLTKTDKKQRGTEIILHIAEDCLEFLEDNKIEELLTKYCSFMPIEIKFGEKLINDTQPLWNKKPADITDQEYLDFYNKLYPFSSPPLFWIHLNVDYPFNLTGILYFPKWSNSYDIQRNKIKLYSNQVFVTEEVKDIVPEFLTLLHGVIDSPDIPLNVSRSYLQADSNVKKISAHIVKKVADKLSDIFKKDRTAFEEKWEDIGFFVKFGSLTDEKFFDKAKEYSLLKDTEKNLYTFTEYSDKVKENQTDKEGKLNWIYTTDATEQHGYIAPAIQRGYSVLEFNQPIDLHYIQHLESKLDNTVIKRVDSSSIESLITKEQVTESVLTTDEQITLSKLFEDTLSKTADKIQVKVEAHAPTDLPISIIESEWMRRMKDMSKMNGGGGMGDMWANMPDTFEVVLNANHPIYKSLLEKDSTEQSTQINYLYDLARLSKNILKGEELTRFIQSSYNKL